MIIGPGWSRNSTSKEVGESGESAMGECKVWPGATVCLGNTGAAQLGSRGRHQLLPHGVPPSAHLPPVFGTEAGETSVTHTALGHPACPRCCGSLACPTPMCPVPHLDLKWVGFIRGGASLWAPRVWGRGRPRLDKGSGLGRGTVPAQRQWLKCPGLSQAHSGLLFPDSPSWGNPSSISTLLTPQCREKPQSREGWTAHGHTASESLWQHSQLPTQGPAPSEDPQRGMWREGEKR